MCMHCGAVIPGRGSYCPSCGALKPSLSGSYGQGRIASPGMARVQYYERVRTSTLPWRRLGRAASAAFMLTFAAYLVVCLAALVRGIDIVMPVIGDHSYSLHIVLVALFPVVTLSGTALEAWYAFLVCAILASAGWVALRSARKFLNEATMRGRPRDHSPFFDMCALMFAVLFINLVIVLGMIATGDEPVVPTDSLADWELLFLLANASVWEELIVRVLLLGLPLVVVDIARGLGARKPHKYLFGGGIEMRWGEAGLVIISSLIFGFAHFEAWGLWKVFPASVAGLAFGYIFLKHGLPAAILLHFAFDYLSMPLVIFDDSLAINMIVGIGVLLWAGLGAIFTIYFIIRIIEFISGRLFFEGETPSRAAVTAASMPQGRTVHPQYFGGANVGSQAGVTTQHQQRSETLYHDSSKGFFVCSFCGSTHARLDPERGLVCLGCGRSYQ